MEISVSLYDSKIRVGHGPMGEVIGKVAITPRAANDRFLPGSLDEDATMKVMHRPADCERELEAAPTFNRSACLPEVFDCSCGRKWVHVCDEAEGCEWVPDGTADESHIVRGSE